VWRGGECARAGDDSATSEGYAKAGESNAEVGEGSAEAREGGARLLSSISGPLITLFGDG